jgi:hypothetical protein
MMRFGMTGNGVYCVVQGSESTIEHETWLAYVEDMKQSADRIRGIVVYSAGSGPNAKQRSIVAELWKKVGRMPMSFIMSESTMHRGMLTALSWMLPAEMQGRLFAHNPSNAYQALMKLGLTSQLEREQVYSVLRGFADEIGHPQLIDRDSVIGEKTP